MLSNPVNIDNSVRGAIYLKNQLLPQILKNKELSLDCFAKLYLVHMLGQVKKISDHYAICIG